MIKEIPAHQVLVCDRCQQQSDSMVFREGSRLTGRFPRSRFSEDDDDQDVRLDFCDSCTRDFLAWKDLPIPSS